MLTKESIEKRIKELDAAILQQGQYVTQMNNQILMFHGAKEEYHALLKQIVATEEGSSNSEAPAKVRKSKKQK